MVALACLKESKVVVSVDGSLYHCPIAGIQCPHGIEEVSTNVAMRHGNTYGKSIIFCWNKEPSIVFHDLAVECDGSVQVHWPFV